MSASQHTPGPWFINRKIKLDDIESLAVCAPTDEQSGEPWLIASAFAWAGQGDEPVEANARLIAAAPDFLAAACAMVEPFADMDDEQLQEAAEALGGSMWIYSGKTLNAHFARAIIAARAAIAKATGGAA